MVTRARRAGAVRVQGEKGHNCGEERLFFIRCESCRGLCVCLSPPLVLHEESDCPIHAHPHTPLLRSIGSYEWRPVRYLVGVISVLIDQRKGCKVCVRCCRPLLPRLPTRPPAFRMSAILGFTVRFFLRAKGQLRRKDRGVFLSEAGGLPRPRPRAAVPPTRGRRCHLRNQVSPENRRNVFLRAVTSFLLAVAARRLRWSLLYTVAAVRVGLADMFVCK